MTPVFLFPQSLRAAPAEQAVRPSAATAATGETGGLDFAETLARAAQNVADTLKASEQTAAAGVLGKTSVQEVAEAVMAAEQALQTSIAVRDKAVAAYLELSRMQI